MGRAWDDAAIVGMAYAFEQVAHGHVAPDTAPALRVVGSHGKPDRPGKGH
jgi:amidase